MADFAEVIVDAEEKFADEAIEVADVKDNIAEAELHVEMSE